MWLDGHLRRSPILSCQRTSVSNQNTFRKISAKTVSTASQFALGNGLGNIR
jgi:hypothetical protein